MAHAAEVVELTDEQATAVVDSFTAVHTACLAYTTQVPHHNWFLDQLAWYLVDHVHVEVPVLLRCS